MKPVRQFSVLLIDRKGQLRGCHEHKACCPKHAIIGTLEEAPPNVGKVMRAGGILTARSFEAIELDLVRH